MQDRSFSMSIQGQLLSHLGVQLYKTRPAALAELVANAYDALATSCMISINRDPVGKQTSIFIDDNGVGMSEDEIETKYLALSRNRRLEDKGQVSGKINGKTISRRVLGRKGIGKLAGFGIAKIVRVTTWSNSLATEFEMDESSLRNAGNSAKVIKIPGRTGVSRPDLGFESGTRVSLEGLRHSSIINVEELIESLSRRFSRALLGQMSLTIDGKSIGEPPEWGNLVFRYPNEGMTEHKLQCGNTIRYWYGFAPKPIKPEDAVGINILVRGKVAQATPFNFSSDGGTRQFHLRYLTGVIEADYLDDGSEEKDGEEDVIQTDRQSINWDHDRVVSLFSWGKQLVSKAVTEWDGPSRKEVVDLIQTDPEIRDRVNCLVPEEKKKIEKMVKIIASTESPDDRARELVDTLVKAFEFRAFFDVIARIEKLSDNPEAFTTTLENMRDWSTLESRALLEIVDGRLKILSKLQLMILSNAPERAPRVGVESLHDLLADHPWILNPEWVVIEEERALRTLLHEKEEKEERNQLDDGSKRVDFLALRQDSQKTVLIEIKAPGHPVAFAELTRFLTYIAYFRDHCDGEVDGVFIADKFAIDKKSLSDMKNLFEIKKWESVLKNSRKSLLHFQSVLEANVSSDGFNRKKTEIQNVKRTLDLGAVRGDRKTRPLGTQDATEKEVDTARKIFASRKKGNKPKIQRTRKRTKRRG